MNKRIRQKKYKIIFNKYDIKDKIEIGFFEGCEKIRKLYKNVKINKDRLIIKIYTTFTKFDTKQMLRRYKIY